MKDILRYVKNIVRGDMPFNILDTWQRQDEKAQGTANYSESYKVRPEQVT